MSGGAAPRGPLAGVRVLEFASLGPGPHCAMLLSDLGCDVVRIERPGAALPNPVMDRGRATLTVDIRTEAGRERCLAAADLADVVIEGLRPGVMERLGLGPELLTARNPRLIYGRMTGWGQDGPLARAAGHDINYIALTGALAAIGAADGAAIPPLNLVGDFGGGSLFLALGIASALFERERSGNGQVIDAAIVDGVASLMAMFAGMTATGLISVDRRRNMLGGAAPFYRCYTCADGKDIAIGAIEPQFYRELLDRIDAPAELREAQHEVATWAERGEVLARLFATRSRDDWCAVLEGTDACFAPVLALGEAPDHAHIRARGVYERVDGVAQPAPAPRLSRTPGRIGPTGSGEDMLARWAGLAEVKKSDA